MPAIDPSTPVPLYYQLKELIKEQIDNGTLKPGDKVPTEDELCKQYDISRTPVRQALTELVNEGLVIRTPGRGTFVASTTPQFEEVEKPVLRVLLSDARWREPLEGAASLWNSAHSSNPLSLDFQMVPLRDLRSTLVAAVGQGEAPDISVLDSVWIAEFAQQHYLYALDEIDGDWFDNNKDSFLPPMLAANSFQTHLYGMPIGTDMSVLWYRRDWFASEGLAPPTTWDELLAIGHHFRQSDVRSRYGLGEHPLVFVGSQRGGETTMHQLLPFLWAAGGDLVADEQVVLNSPQNHQAVEFLKALIHEYQLVPPAVTDFAWDEAAHSFAVGRAALALGGTYESFFIQQIAGWDEALFREQVGFVPMPAGPQGQPATLVGGMSYVIYRQTRAAQQALALLDLTGHPEILKPFSLRTGHVPPRLPIAESLTPEKDGFVAQIVPLLAQARARPTIPEYARVSAQFRTMIESGLAGRAEVDEIISLTAEKISAITDLPVAW